MTKSAQQNAFVDKQTAPKFESVSSSSPVLNGSGNSKILRGKRLAEQQAQLDLPQGGEAEPLEPIELAQAVGEAAGLSDVPVASDNEALDAPLQGLVGPAIPVATPLMAALGVGAVAASGGSGGVAPAPAERTIDNPTPTPVQPAGSTVSGVVIDGYIRDAKVFLDQDDDGVHDEGEVFTFTDAEGRYVLQVDEGTEGVLRVVGGTNINSDGSNGAPNTATLSAPLVFGESREITLNVTPLTTLIEALVQGNQGLTAAEAAEQLGNALGLNGVNLLTFDSIEAEKSGATEVDRSQALLVNKVAAQVVALINSVSNSIESSSDANKAQVDSLVADSISRQIAEQLVQSVADGINSLSNILNAEGLSAVINSTLTEVAKNPLVGEFVNADEIRQLATLANLAAVTQIAAIDKAQSSDDISVEQVSVSSNKAPVAGPTQSVELQENTNFVGVFAAKDSDVADTLLYSLAGENAALFNVDPVSGAVTFKKSPDFESLETKIFKLTVVATDQFGASSTQAVTVNVTDVQDTADVLALQAALEKAALQAASTQKLLDEQIAKLKTEIEVLTVSGQAKDADVAALKKQLEELQLKLDSAAKEAASKQAELEKKVAALQASGASKDIEIATLKDQLAKNTADAEAKQKGLQESVDKLTAETTKLKEDLAAREAEIATLEKSLVDSQAKFDATQKLLDEQIAKLKTEIDVLTVSGQSKDADVAALKKQLEELQLKLDSAAKEAASKQAELEKKVAALQASGASKDIEIATLKDQLAKNTADAEAKQKSLEAELLVLKNSIPVPSLPGIEDTEVAIVQVQVTRPAVELKSIELKEDGPTELNIAAKQLNVSLDSQSINGADASLKLTLTGTQVAQTTYELKNGVLTLKNEQTVSAESADGVHIELTNNTIDVLDVLVKTGSISTGGGADQVVVRDDSASAQVLAILFDTGVEDSGVDTVTFAGYKSSDFMANISTRDEDPQVELTSIAKMGLEDTYTISNAEKFVFSDGTYVVSGNMLVQEAANLLQVNVA